MTYRIENGTSNVTVTYSSDVETLGEFMREAKAAFASEGHEIDAEKAEAAYLSVEPDYSMDLCVTGGRGGARLPVPVLQRTAAAPDV